MRAGKKGTPLGPVRRTQAERTEATRKRLIDATVTCLAEEGYAGVTIAKVAEFAGVSNGTPLHHFDNKESLLASAAEFLLDWMYGKVGDIYSAFHEKSDWVMAIVERSWYEVFNTPEYRALMEIILASHREPSLSRVVQPLFDRTGTAVMFTGRQYLEPVEGDYKLDDLSMLVHWIFRGMAMQAHMMDSKQQRRYLDDIAQLLLDHIRPKAEVTDSSRRYKP